MCVRGGITVRRWGQEAGLVSCLRSQGGLPRCPATWIIRGPQRQGATEFTVPARTLLHDLLAAALALGGVVATWLMLLMLEG
jgi:hypothetical protein